MNCEKCKTKKASVFYADENGKRHALCSACSASSGKAVSPISERVEKGESLTPSSGLLFNSKNSFTILKNTPRDKRCKLCGTTLGKIEERGALSCPECYKCFFEALFPIPYSTSISDNAHMPLSYKTNIETRKKLAQLKAMLKNAVEEENYELAATLRDKIKAMDLKIN